MAEEVPIVIGHRQRDTAAGLKTILEDGELGATAGGLVLLKKYGAAEYFALHQANHYNADSFDSFAAAVAAIGSAPASLVVSSQQTISANLTIPDNISLVRMEGGSFGSSNASELIISGPFSSPLSQAFTGNIVVKFGSPMEYVPLEWWGAQSTDYTTAPTYDCAAAINSAVAAVKTYGGTIEVLDRQYAFGSRIDIDTSATGSLVRIRGRNDWRSVLYYTGTQSPALKFGSSGVSNSGLVDLVDIHVSGAGTTSEVAGVEIYNAQRYTHWDNVRIRAFSKGRGLHMYFVFTTGWGNITIDQCYQGLYGTVVNSFNFKSVHVEVCGPHSGYTHSTIALTDPTVYMNGGGCQFDTLEIEGNLAINSCVIEEQVTILNYYSEGNEPHNSGHEITFKGRKPALISGLIYPGVYGSPPNPRYIVGMGDSQAAYIENLVVLHNVAPDATNTTYGVDFETSTGARVNVWMQQYNGGISQETAWNQTFKGNSSSFSFNGQRFVAGMPAAYVGRLLLKNFNAIPTNWTGIMNKIASGSDGPNGYIAENLHADSGLTKFWSPYGGNGRTMYLKRSAAAAFGIYYQIASGTLSTTDKYFISSHVYRESSSSSCVLRVLNGATDQYWSPRIDAWVGWQRISSVRTLANAGTSAVNIYPAYCSGDVTHYTGGLCCINLSAFDALYGTALADLPVHEIEQIVDFGLVADENREMTRQEVPTNGQYYAGDRVDYFLSDNVPQYLGAVCRSDGTPGSWIEVGAIPATYSGAWDPGSMADGAVTHTTVTVGSASVGMPARATLTTIGANNVLISAHVESANTVRVILENKTGGSLDIGSGTLRVEVFK